MSEFSPPNSETPINPETESITKKPSIANSISQEEALLITLIVLSTVGLGITNFWPYKGFIYWVAMVPVFAITSLYIGWTKARKRGEGVSRIIRVQLLHWVGLLTAIGLVYLLYSKTGQIDKSQFALVTLTCLALATFFAGVHFEWRFMVVGVILGAAVAGAAVIEQVIWMIIIPIAALIILAIFWWKRKT